MFINHENGNFPLIIISGATATGKTDLAILLAQKIIGEGKKSVIINFDSLLFYKELNIGTAKPTKEELDLVPHKMVDIASIDSPLTASDYIDLAEKEINEAFKNDIIPILVGGSAFYIRALIKGMYDSPKISDELKKELETLYKSQGIEPIISLLQEHDPESLKVLHENDHYRLIRAAEHFKATGNPISKQKEKLDALDPYDFSINSHKPWAILHLYLDIEKESHFEIIKNRTNKMIDLGLVNEVQEILNKDNFSGKERPLQSIGYKETLDYISHKYKSTDAYKERISISTRQLAKSQRTFFKKVTPKFNFNPLAPDTNEKIWNLTKQFLKI